MKFINLLKVISIVPSQIARCYSKEVPKALRSLKAKSTRNTVQYYIDSYRIRAVAGNGGDGCISFLSAWCKDQAGPDGGDGGHGGHVIFKATHSVKSLNHCKTVTQAKHGEKGYNKDCNGKNAEHVVVPVPLGTIIKDQSGRMVADLSTEGVMFVAARGGAGGRGNKFFLSDTEQAPDVAELGAQGETHTYTLEVRSMAHVGLLGAPNAGKSTLLRALTRARPTVAAYPFTTLRPHIGMVPYDDYEQVAIADLPGLIPGSHKNYGLGIQFLQHVERCRGLVFLLDGADEPRRQYDTLSHELAQYSEQLAKRPQCVVVNKIDLPEGKRGFEDMKKKMDVIGISAKTGLNLAELLRIIRVMYDENS
ncbi:mitochondrial ribosome-associated GTPase 2 [Amyelois transitella]|uniref:mitochondrial ribosome-associated GTPase 2 n=1 Tax=Amyelois transitella TaxID=680683 RepID=UPI00067AEC8A|nr:mitochondrial ribosome-associated GTPase 2 [Amyelois transitella]